MTFLLKFVDWIAKTGETEVARQVEVSRQSVHAWRRWAGGAPRSSEGETPRREHGLGLVESSRGEDVDVALHLALLNIHSSIQ